MSPRSKKNAPDPLIERRILAWEKYKRGNVYQRARKLIRQEDNVENVLYQMFIAGYEYKAIDAITHPEDQP